MIFSGPLSLLLLASVPASWAGEPVRGAEVKALEARAGAPADPRVAWTIPLDGRVNAMDWLGGEVALRLSRSLVLLDPDVPGAARRVALPGVPAGPVVGERERLALPVVGGDFVVVTSGVAHLWHTPGGFTHISGIQGGLVLGREGGSHLAAFDLETGELRWKTKVAYSNRPPAAIPGLLAGIRGKDVRVVHVGRGSAAWQTRLPHTVVQVEGAYAGDAFYALETTGELSALDGLDGHPRWSRRLPGLGALAATATLRDDADAIVIVAGGRVFRVAHEDGSILSDTLLGKRDTTVDPDVFEGRLCTAPFGGGLSCGPVGEAPLFTVPVGTVTAPPLLLGDTVLVATADKKLHRIRVDVGEETGVGGRPQGTALVQIGLDLVPIPLVSVEGEGPCDSHSLTLDLRDRAGPGHPLELQIDALSRRWGSGEEGWSFGPAWAVEPHYRRWEVSYWYAWEPEVIDAFVRDGTEEDAADLDALLHCELDAGTWVGELRARELGVTRLYQGRLHAEALPHEVDGEPGCLLELSLDDEPIGVWAGPGEDAWMDLHIAFENAATDPILPTEPGPPEGLLDGEVVIETLLPGRVDRYHRSFDGEVELDVHQDQLELRLNGEAILGLAVPDLRYAAMVPGRFGGAAAPGLVPEVDHEGSWALRARTDERFLPIWTLPACLESPDPAAPAGAAVPPVDADPMPQAPPTKRRNGLRGKPTPGPLPQEPVLPPLDPVGAGP